MALNSTIYKAMLNIADMDRAYYADHALTLALHPSETEERLMVRVLAFAMHADERLAFGRGLSNEEEPALSLSDYDGRIRLWIEVGLPDERVLRRAAGRADQVVVIAYGGKAADVWWSKQKGALARLQNLTVWSLSEMNREPLIALATRGMQLQCTIQDGQVWLTDGAQTAHIEPRRIMAPDT